MSREVRRVPPGWQHPKKADGGYVPLFEGPYEAKIARWIEGRREWAMNPRSECTWEEWAGDAPQSRDYMPTWGDDEKTHLQMYESTSEGTPISPVLATPEELAQWLVDNNASSFADRTATYEQWLAVARGRYAPSAVISSSGVLMSGVEATERAECAEAAEGP